MGLSVLCKSYVAKDLRCVGSIKKKDTSALWVKFVLDVAAFLAN